MQGKAMQAWTSLCNWEGRKKFRVGTFFLAPSSGIEEVRAAAVREAIQFFKEILPVDVPPPDTIIPLPGMVIFLPENETAETH